MSTSGLKISTEKGQVKVFAVLGPRCWTGPSLLDCHVLKGFGMYMIGILGRLY